MINNRLKNPFENSRISDITFDKFTKAHIERLRSHTDNTVIAGFLSATEPLYKSFHEIITRESGKGADKKGETLTSQLIMDEIKKFVRRKEGVLADALDDRSPEYLAFFPQGLSEYNKAGKDKINILLERFINAATKQSDKLGPDLISQATLLLERYNKARDLQLKGKGSVSGVSRESEEKRKALSLQLFLNLLDLLRLHATEPHTVKMYYDLSLVKTSNGGTGDDNKAEGDVILKP